MRTSLAVFAAAFVALSARAGVSADASYKTLIELGRQYGAADDYAQAESAYREALAIETWQLGANAAPIGDTLAELALQVSNQERFDEAAALFQRATPIVEGSGSAAARARLQSYLALDAANRRQFADALKFAHQATAARRIAVSESGADGAPSPESRGELAHSLRIEAEMALRQGDLATAQAAADEALWIVSDEPGLPLWWKPEAIALLGEVNAREGRVVAAERNFQDSRDLDLKLFGETGPTARAELRLGAFYSDQQVYPAAVESYRAAFAILDKNPLVRAQLSEDRLAPFITAALAQGKMEAEIFRASQLAGSGVAGQTADRVAARHASGDPALDAIVREADGAARDRDRARMDLAAETAKPADERDETREEKLETAMKAAAARAGAAAAKLHADFPAYAGLAAPGPVALADVQARLGAGEAFLSFVIGSKESYALLVTQSGLSVRKIDARADQLAQDIASLRASFVPKLGKLPEFPLKTANALYGQLLGPLDLGGITHLVVAPKGDLASLPFALLVSEAPRERDYKDAAWLIARMSLHYEPSARAFTAAARRSHASRIFLGIGDPVFGGGQANAMAALSQSCQQGGAVSPDLLRGLAPLPGTRGEVTAVAAELGGGTTLFGDRASEAALRAEPLDQYRVIYFATHGLLPGELHCQGEPGLVLTPPRQASSAGNDGLLSASEIASLKLDADFVVLSACNTAAAGGTRFGGGALEGLAEAFFDAGARSVLASHWEVPSAETASLMRKVFAGRPADIVASLRGAQLSMIADPKTAHPFNWAAFTLIGEPVWPTTVSLQESAQ